MRRSSLALAVFAGTLVVSGGAVVGLSAASSGKIAPGIHVGEVQLGGLTAAEARSRLQSDLVDPLQRPIVFERRGQKFSLSADEAQVKVDIDRTVRSAVDASDEGDMFTHAWRAISGSKINRSLEVEVTTSHDAVVRFVDRVRRELDRTPKPAELTFDGDRPNVRPARDGMAVDRKKLASLVREEAQNAARDPRLVPVNTERSPVTEEKLRQNNGTVIVVNRNEHKLFLYKQLKLAKTYSVAVGMQGLETPAGTYTINDKQIDPVWHVPNSAWAGSMAGKSVPPGPSNPIKARWMGFYDGAGIHGTSDDSSIGSSASHGCVRMHVSDVIDLYDRVPVSTAIHII